MLVIKKVLNTSVVLVEDNNQQEFIILGKGIGYGKQAGTIIPASEAQQIFIPVAHEQSLELVNMLQKIPYELLEITKHITDDAEKQLGKSLNKSLYFMLADHLSFAIERSKSGFTITNRVYWEIKSFYREEFALGLEALKLIEESLAISLPEAEAANIAFHIVNAQVEETENYDVARIAKLIGEMLDIIQYTLVRKFAAKDANFVRLVIHLKFFAERYFMNAMLNEHDTLFIHSIFKNYPLEYDIAKKIDIFIQHQYTQALTPDELLFLVIHIHRIMM